MRGGGSDFADIDLIDTPHSNTHLNMSQIMTPPSTVAIHLSTIVFQSLFLINVVNAFMRLI